MEYIIRGKKIIAEGQEEFWKDVAAGRWEPGSFDVLDRFLGPGKLFADIGAWNGVLSLYASALGADCIVIEPDPEAFKVLEKNWMINDGTHWELDATAIGPTNKDGQLYNHPGQFGNSCSTILSNRAAGEIGEPVFMQTMYSFFGPQIASCTLVKMDIEGGELAVIDQAEEYLTKTRPTMYISFHPNWFPGKAKGVDRLANILFKIYKCENPAGAPVTESVFRDSLMHTQDQHSFVFIPR